MTKYTVNREDTTAATESPCTPQAPTTANLRYSLSNAVARHIRLEKASFHTPGHKGRQEFLFQHSSINQDENCGKKQDRIQYDTKVQNQGRIQNRNQARIQGDNQAQNQDQSYLNVLSRTHYLCSARDLTELPGLDDLSAPVGAIADLEERAARLWDSGGHAFVSVNGASAALIAAILATAHTGDFADRNAEQYAKPCAEQYALIPRNAHRSVINALCLARLKPIWYEPKFEHAWGFWGATTAPAIKLAIEEAKLLNARVSIACAVVVSPTYCGALSDITAIAELTKLHNIPLIVDEAHGAHFFPQYKNGSGSGSGASSSNGSSKSTITKTNICGINMPTSAIACGADAVAHSWHKTLPALTQTGMLHLPKGSLISPVKARSSLNLITSSSPSYLLLDSIEKTLTLLESEQSKESKEGKPSHHLLGLSQQFRRGLADLGTVKIYDTADGINPSHVLISTGPKEAHHLYNFLQDRGIFAEAILGAGVLFMLGLGSQTADVELALAAIKDFVSASDLNAKDQNYNHAPLTDAHSLMPSNKFLAPAFEPVLPPHQAMLMPQETVPVSQALGRISAQCLSPCPPGIPILIPGQKITEEVLKLVSDKTIVVVAQ